VFDNNEDWTDAELAAVSKRLKTRSPMCWTQADRRLAYHYLDILDTFLAYFRSIRRRPDGDCSGAAWGAV
jgi:hypothetical protein